VNRDGGDELVAVVPNNKVYYFPYLPPQPVILRGILASPPALADVDGDGSLETALRTDSSVYLLTGFGTPVSGWPKRLDDVTIERERGAPPAPPIIGDVNGDGRTEIVFRIAGDLHAFDYHGSEIAGWPLAGEGATGGSPAFLSGEGGELYIFDSAAFTPYSIESGLGGGLKGAVSSLRRYDPKCAYPSRGVWPCYRHDAAGSSRQLLSAAESPREARVDPSTFIIYPNPATGRDVTVRVLVSAPAEVKSTIVDIEGEVLFESKRSHPWFEGSAVPFEWTIATNDFVSGVYICRLEVTGNGWSWRGFKKFSVIR
jgi:hypothetical protein